MVRNLIFVALAIFASAAFATGNYGGTTNNYDYNTVNAPKAEADARATAVATQGQSQGQMQGQVQGQLQGQAQGQGQTATGGNATNAGNAQSTSVTINEGSTPKQATSGPGIASSPTATCRIAAGVSVGGTFGGVGAFGSIEDERCADMERGRHMAEVLGRPDAAHRLACTDEKMAKALGDCQ
jgi:hypothetical protein